MTNRRIFISLMLSLVVLFAQAYTQPLFVPGDSLHEFNYMPWKCVFTNVRTGETYTRYYTREGVEKARGTVDSQSFTAMNQGSDNKDYYETYRTNKNGETRLVRNWYNYGADFGRKPVNKKYRYEPSDVDSHGNWTYAEVHLGQDACKREIFYYDEAGYDTTEDSLIDQRISQLVEYVNEQENPLNPTNILVSAFGLVAKLLYLYGLFVLFMLAFMRQRFYLWFDLHATRKITPYGNRLFNRTLLCGLIPVLAALLPTGMYVLSGKSTAIVPMWLIVQSGIGLGVALLFCVIYMAVRSRYCPARCARWELIYSMSVWLCIWAGVLFSIYVVVLGLIALFFLGMIFGKGGSLPSDDNMPDNMQVTAWDGEGQHLQRLSGNNYIDNHGNLYAVNGGGVSRLSDNKPFMS